MAVSVSVVPGTLQYAGNQRTVVADVTFDSSYQEGGEPLTAADFELTVLDSVVPGVAVAADDTGLVTSWNEGVLRLFTTSGDAGALEEVASTTDVDAYTVRVTALGK